MNSVELMFWTLVFVCVAEAGMIGDQCDWTGSGLSARSEDNLERGVRPVYLRCREGSLSWVYPRGALRLLFNPPLPPSERDFRVCVRVLRRPDPPDIFHEYVNYTEPTRFPARLFVEGPERLLPLYAADDGDPRETRCFRSRNGRAALYVEADPEDGPGRREASLVYETRALHRHYDPATADCRPCTHAELELAFCTSDLVSRGIIVGAEQRHDLDTTQLTIKLTKPIRANRENDDNYIEDNALEDKTYGKRRNVRSLHAHIHVGAACGASEGAGEFMVMARRRLGKLSLICAPRVEDWADVVARRNADGTAHCVLQD